MIQEREGWSDAVMAARLKIARSTWTEVRNGRLPLSHKVQMAAATAFPELLGELVRSVSSVKTADVA
ncbi:MAG: hypothetical protein ACYDCI_05720 [Candidatus Limnocylindrales bacterium]